MPNRVLSFGLAAFLWLACAVGILMLGYLAVRGTLEESGFLGRLLAQPGWERAAPLAVLVVFTWILLQVLIRALRIRREQAALPIFRSWSVGALQSIPERLRIGRRAQIVQRHLSSPGKLAEALPATAALDAAAAENTYTILKAFVWTLPVLGFIDTARGMSHAIGGFSKALEAASQQAQTQQIEYLTGQLAQLVIPGLANAFAITMVALGASIIAHYWTTVLQTWDQDVLCDLDQVCVAKLADISPANGAMGVPRDLLATLNDHLAQLAHQVAALNGKLNLFDAAEYLKQSAKEHVSAAQAVRQAASELQESVRAPYHITISREQVQ